MSAAEEEVTDDHIKNIFERAEVLRQLLMFHRFRDFVDINYDVHRNTDPDTSVRTVVVTEALPHQVAERMRKLAKEQMQQEIDEIKLATPEEAREILKRK